MDKAVEMELTPKSIQKAIKEVEIYRKDIEIRSKILVSSLLNMGINIVKAEIVKLDIYDTGNLLNSVDTYYSESDNYGYIRVNCEYAVFVEFGTGIVGKTSPYVGDAMADVGYKYGGGTHYIVTKDGRIGWIYRADDGTYRFTEGMPSRPFMFNSMQMLRKEFPKIAKAVFK